jgi:hypothetical protein
MMISRILTVVLVTMALGVAGPIVARALAKASPADQRGRTATAVSSVTQERNLTDGGDIGGLSDEAAIALMGTALLALAAAMKKAA